MAKEQSMQPQLYLKYDGQEAVAFFGKEHDAQTLCNGHWIVLKDVVICLADLGEPPTASHFESGSHFMWVADKPYRVNDKDHSYFLPMEVVGPKAKASAMHLFVRPRAAAKYHYIGVLEPSYMQQAPGAENYGMARFEFHPTLPSAVWAELGGYQAGDRDHVPVDEALDRLRQPTSVQDRLEVLRQLVNYWHGPIRPEDGFSKAEVGAIKLPFPLKWWYEWAGRRTEIMSGQNHFFAPKQEVHKYWELKPADPYLRFYVENQGVYEWATLPEGEDPPVFGRYGNTDAWESENISCSEHLILACLFEAVNCHSNYGASAACLEGSVLSAIAEGIRPIAIGPWRWLGPTRFYARNGAFMVSMSNGTDVYSVWIGARTERPLKFLKPYLDDAWEYQAI